ncbi:MAG: type II/IV secretion system protein [Bacteroidetes bacterium]|nr:type II/IV secretion system protein [Bacteroidota bacterium]
MENTSISTEILQIISSYEAYNYKIVPYMKDTDTITFYGEKSVDYIDIKDELEILLGKNIIITQIENSDFDKLINKNYREGSSNNESITDVKTISQGKGFLINLIEEAFDCYASDIHFEPYDERCRIRFRVDGQLIERYVIDKVDYPSLINQIKIFANLDISEKRLPQDGRIFFNKENKKFDVRVSSLPTIYGEKIVLRLLTRHKELLDIENLGFSERELKDYKEAINNPHGLILITGPTGSGKSTTLYATLRLLNNNISNILTIEDPVEYTLEGINQVQLKEDIGLTFGVALRTFLRQDPDIIMLGEIRDGDTAQMAIRSALTGHLILSTIHTNSAWGSISRLSDMGVHEYLISDTLVMCVAQRLVRLLCPHCKKRGEKYYSAVGCDKCYHTGYMGRKAIYEVIKIDNNLREFIKKGENDITEYLIKNKITTLSDSALNLLNSGLTSQEEVLSIITKQAL